MPDQFDFDVCDSEPTPEEIAEAEARGRRMAENDANRAEYFRRLRREKLASAFEPQGLRKDHWFAFEPTITPWDGCNDGTPFNPETFVLRKVFLFILWKVAIQEFHGLWNEVFPAYQSLCSQVNVDSELSRFRGWTYSCLDPIAALTWSEVNGEIDRNVLPFAQALQTWATKHNLWFDWIIDDILLRLRNVMPNGPRPQIADEADGSLLDVEVVRDFALIMSDWNRRLGFGGSTESDLEVSFSLKIEQAAEKSGTELLAILDRAYADKRESIRLQHKALKKETGQQLGRDKKQLDHFEWLIRYMVLGQTYEEIYRLDSAKDNRVRGLDAVRKGIQLAADAVGLDIRNIRKNWKRK